MRILTDEMRALENLLPRIISTKGPLRRALFFLWFGYVAFGYDGEKLRARLACSHLKNSPVVDHVAITIGASCGILQTRHKLAHGYLRALAKGAFDLSHHILNGIVICCPALVKMLSHEKYLVELKGVQVQRNPRRIYHYKLWDRKSPNCDDIDSLAAADRQQICPNAISSIYCQRQFQPSDVSSLMLVIAWLWQALSFRRQPPPQNKKPRRSRTGAFLFKRAKITRQRLQRPELPWGRSWLLR